MIDHPEQASELPPAKDTEQPPATTSEVSETARRPGGRFRIGMKGALLATAASAFVGSKVHDELKIREQDRTIKSLRAQRDDVQATTLGHSVSIYNLEKNGTTIDLITVHNDRIDLHSPDYVTPLSYKHTYILHLGTVS